MAEPRDWTTPDGRAELRRWIDEPYRSDDAACAIRQLLTVLEEAEGLNDEAEKALSEVRGLRERAEAAEGLVRRLRATHEDCIYTADFVGQGPLDERCALCREVDDAITPPALREEGT